MSGEYQMGETYIDSIIIKASHLLPVLRKHRVITQIHASLYFSFFIGLYSISSHAIGELVSIVYLVTLLVHWSL